MKSSKLVAAAGIVVNVVIVYFVMVDCGEALFLLFSGTAVI